VKENIEKSLVSKGLTDKVAHIVIPTEEVMEMRKGKKTIISRNCLAVIS